MNKTELIAEVAAKTGMTKKDTDKVVTMVVPTNEELAIARETVKLVK